jgi:hypothetical protein
MHSQLGRRRFCQLCQCLLRGIDFKISLTSGGAMGKDTIETR